MKAERSFEPQMAMQSVSLPPGGEWVPKFHGCLFAQVSSGIAYWWQPDAPEELSAGAVLVLARNSQGVLRASQLSDVLINYFCVTVDKLTGLLSLGEQQSLRAAVAREPAAGRILAIGHPLAQRFQAFPGATGSSTVFVRLQLLLLVLDYFRDQLEAQNGDTEPNLDGRRRLRQFLQETAASEFLELSLTDLVPRMHVSPRHLSRLFREEVGMSFREKQTELRLNKACHLLATTEVKLIEVALASGYQSDSLFNLMFKKRFGMSPGKWRRQNLKKGRRRQGLVRMLPS
jgi:AraC-like DNA-binding protein